MTQRKNMAVCGTLKEIVAYDGGDPHYCLSEWLTPTKPRFLLRPKFKSEVALGLGVFARPFDDRSWPHLIDSAFYRKTWVDAIKKVVQDDHPIQQMKTQCKEHVDDHVHFAELSKTGVLG